mmetsp:Transcript_2688/g.9909  ORF Transcript_2688/g.9909 Transcript_2688/m.9909 type:complete len:290 (-) Transcript_2688:1286-2155(-)
MAGISAGGASARARAASRSRGRRGAGRVSAGRGGWRDVPREWRGEWGALRMQTGPQGFRESGGGSTFAGCGGDPGASGPRRSETRGRGSGSGWAPSTRQRTLPSSTTRRQGRSGGSRPSATFPSPATSCSSCSRRRTRVPPATRPLPRQRRRPQPHLHPHPHPQWSRLVMRQWRPSRPPSSRKFPRGRHAPRMRRSSRGRPMGRPPQAATGDWIPRRARPSSSSRLWQRASPPRTRPRTAAFAGRLLPRPHLGLPLSGPRRGAASPCTAAARITRFRQSAAAAGAAAQG